MQLLADIGVSDLPSSFQRSWIFNSLGSADLPVFARPVVAMNPHLLCCRLVSNFAVKVLNYVGTLAVKADIQRSTQALRWLQARSIPLFTPNIFSSVFHILV